MSRDFPPYEENRYHSWLPESYHGDSRPHAVTQHLSDPTAPELSMPNSMTPLTMLKTTANTSLQCSLMGSVEGHADGSSVAETCMPRDPTTSSGSRQGSALADDEHFVRRSEEELRKEEGWRMVFVWRVIGVLLFDEVECWDCPRMEELWLRIIEGDDDDLWLWVDGDEEWLTKQKWIWGGCDPTDWLSAQSALRRRVTQRRYPPATARNEKIRSATRERRAYVIAWLIASSKAVAGLFASHGCTPPTFRTPKLASTLSNVVCKNWDAFPSQTDDWATAVTRSKEDGCICSPADCDGLRKWFDMMVWLEDCPSTLVVGDKSCVRCRSLLKLRYEDIAANCAVTLHVSLLDALEGYCNYERVTFYLRPLSPTAKLLVDGTLERLMKKHGYHVGYLPPVNRYPECLRSQVAKLLCGNPISREDRSRTSRLPDNVFAGANDPWVVVGTIFDCVIDDGHDEDEDDEDEDDEDEDDEDEDAYLHDHDWHDCFSFFLRRSLQCFDMPALPLLSPTGLALCHALDHDYSEDLMFCQSDYDTSRMYDSDWVKSDRDGQQLRLTTAVIVAVTTFLRNKDVDLQSCRRCQDICTVFFTGTPSDVGFDVVNPGDCDNVLEGSLSSPLQVSFELGMQELTGMEAILRNSTISKDEVHSQLTGKLDRLRQYFGSFGVDISNGFHRSGIGSRPCLEHVRDHGISSSKLSKSDKVEKIKDKLLEMLREHDLPYERLPWYTLEKDLKKHGCALVNWPAGVLRKRGNRGIHDLSAVEVNSLYEAITCLDESRRLRICRRPSTLTVVPVQQIDHTPAAASGSKRSVEELDSPGHPSKRIRFRDMTSKVSQQHLSDLRADGATGA